MNKTRAIEATTLALVLLSTVAAVGAAPSALTPATQAGGAMTDFIAALEGGWSGNDNDTPFGKMPFAVLFEWTEDGSLHSRSSLNRETYIDLRFERNDDGTWMLHEEAAMEGLGVQSYSLMPSSEPGEAGAHRWVWEQNPEFLTIDVGLTGDTMRLDVLLRGRPHVAFRLDKQPRETWADMKRGMLEQAEQAPAEGVSILEVVSNPPERTPSDGDSESRPATADPIELARREIADSPGNAEAHLALARLLAAAIEDSPANGPRYAFEMLSALESAVALDNRLAEAYHYLVGYYLNAPPIAGGSIDKAEATARALAEFDAAGAERLLGQIAARRESRPPNGSGR